MRILTILLGCMALTFGMVGCEDDPIDLFDTPQSDNGTNDVPTNDTPTGDTANDTPTGVQYFAVMVEDSPDYDCSANQKAHGADIDAVELIDNILGESVSFATNAAGTPGDGLGNCESDGPADTDKQNPADILGEPNGTLSTGYVALAGGFMTVEFGSNQEILTGVHAIRVLEVGVGDCDPDVCGDEAFLISVATDLTCTPSNVDCFTTISSDANGDALVDF